MLKIKLNFYDFVLLIPLAGLILAYIFSLNVATTPLLPSFLLAVTGFSLLYIRTRTKECHRKAWYQFNLFLSAFFAGLFLFSLNLRVYENNKKIFLSSSKQIVTVLSVTDQASIRYQKKATVSWQSTHFPKQSYTIDIFFPKNSFVYPKDRLQLVSFSLKSGNIFEAKDGKIGSIFYIPKQTKIRKIGKANNWYLNFYVFRQKFVEKFLSKFSLVSQTFVGQLFLGMKAKELAVNVRQFFANWGASHYLARSGLHVNIFANIWVFLFLLLPIGLGSRLWLSIFITIGYFLLTFSSISFLRAEIMFWIATLLKIFSRSANTLHTLLLTALLVLLVNPFQIIGIDFQLSFLLVFALSIASKINTD